MPKLRIVLEVSVNTLPRRGDERHIRRQIAAGDYDSLLDDSLIKSWPVVKTVEPVPPRRKKAKVKGREYYKVTP